MARLGLTASWWQVATYLCGVALFSISFLVFLNSLVSYVITDLIGQRTGVGDAVGTLGFGDELVVLVACPLWGILSDRIGVRSVAVIGYVIIGLSLFLFVQARNVYPQLLLARLFFSTGAAATSTMVTAILPTMTQTHSGGGQGSCPTRKAGPHGSNHIVTPSISSELTITPARYRSSSPQPSPIIDISPASVPPQSRSSTTQLAGLVGMFTGLGALLALGLFLPLPARFQSAGVSSADSIIYTFYIVGCVALMVAIFCLFGLRSLPGEEEKSLRALLPSRSSSFDSSFEHHAMTSRPTYPRLLLAALWLGLNDTDVLLGYVGGFAARASSVCISLFIPLFVNAYFISSGRCSEPSNNPGDIQRKCPRAYTVAAQLTGTSQLVALLSAPVYGYVSTRFARDGGRGPLLFAALTGVVGYLWFAHLENPDPKSDDGPHGWVFFVVALIGLSQIGAIVCSLGLLGRGVQKDEREHEQRMLSNDGTARVTSGSTSPSRPASRDVLGRSMNGTAASADETRPLLPSHSSHATLSTTTSTPNDESIPRSDLKGSVAGMYSFFGGAGILLLTKLGGALFDTSGRGAPFTMLAAFNVVLLVVGTACVVTTLVLQRRRTARDEKDEEDDVTADATLNTAEHDDDVGPTPPWQQSRDNEQHAGVGAEGRMNAV